MSEAIAFLLGGGIFSVIFVIRQRVLRKGKMRADENTYKIRWQEAIELLQGEGKITDEQLKQITPTEPLGFGAKIAKAIAKSDQQQALQCMSSRDRRELEITRAKEGLAPIDNLEGMASRDAAAVRQARMRYGTEQ
jgi:hypothetical protein